MTTIAFLDALPLTVVFFVLIGLFAMPYEVGFRFGRWQSAKHGDVDQSQASAVAGALFAVSAFFLAFTFNSVNTTYSARKQLVVDEANVVGTAYLRSQLMPDPFRTDLHNDLRQYVDLRLLGADTSQTGDNEALLKVVADSEALLDKLWQQMLSLNLVDTVDPVIRGLLVEAINEVIDTHTLRVTVAFKRLPTIIVISIGLTVMLTMSVLGYPAGVQGRRSLFAALALMLSLSLVCILIIALERPGASLFDINQKAMVDLRQTM